jgi:hypothetical protein
MAMSDDMGEQPKPPPFPKADLYFYVAGTVIAAPLGKAGIDALFAADYFRALLALTAGISVAVAAFSYRYWESHLSEPARKLIRDLSRYKAFLSVALLVLAAYSFVVVPNFIEVLRGRSELEERYRKQIDNLRAEIKLKTQEFISSQQALEQANLRPTADRVREFQEQGAIVAKQLGSTILERDEARKELATTKQELEAARRTVATPTPMTPPLGVNDSGPVQWDASLNWAQSADANGTIFLWLTVKGKNGPKSIQLKSAFLQSDITGEKRDMVVDAGPDGRLSPGDTNPIPPGAPITLIAVFDPPLRIKQFFDQWRKIEFVAEYSDGARYSHTFDETYIAGILRGFPDSGIGPRVTKRNDSSPAK